MATTKQIEYIDQLAIDLGFDRKQRNAHMFSILNKTPTINRIIDAPSDLTIGEASTVIEQFKKWKEAKRGSAGDQE